MESQTVFGVTVRARVEDFGRHDDTPRAPGVWVEVYLGGVKLYDGPASEFDNDYFVVENMVIGQFIPDFQLRLLEKLEGEGLK